MAFLIYESKLFMNVKNTPSYWEAEYYIDHCDLAIIGGGYVGLSAAYFIRKRFSHLQIHVFERGALPSGASTKNAGFACFGSLSEILDDMALMGEEKVVALIQKRWDGLKLVRSILGDDQIDYEETGGYEVFREEDSALFDNCAMQINHVNRLLTKVIGVKVFDIRDDFIQSMGFNGFKHLIYNPYEGMLNPVKMLKSLQKKCVKAGIHIHHGFELLELENQETGCLLHFSNGLDIQTKRTVVATNGFSRKLMDLPVKPARAQVLITSEIDSLNFAGAYHFHKGYYYFRNLDGRVLFGGGRNMDLSGEETDEMTTTDEIINHLSGILSDHILPQHEFVIEKTWSGIMGVGNEKSPLIHRDRNIYTAVRLGGMGVAIGMNTGKELSELISF